MKKRVGKSQVAAAVSAALVPQQTTPAKSPNPLNSVTDIKADIDNLLFEMAGYADVLRKPSISKRDNVNEIIEAARAFSDSMTDARETFNTINTEYDVAKNGGIDKTELNATCIGLFQKYTALLEQITSELLPLQAKLDSLITGE